MAITRWSPSRIGTTPSHQLIAQLKQWMRTIGGALRGPCSTTCRSPPASLKIRPPGSVTSAPSVSPSVTRALRSRSASSAATTARPIFSRLPMTVVTLAGTMEKFVIQGGVPLSGEVTVAGNKNAALPILAACLLTEDEVLSRRIRASFLLAGPLLARFGEARMPPPGGDFIGRRRLDAHLDAFKDLGARVDGSRWIELSAPGGLAACEIFMDEPSVMGTENALMAAALCPGPTQISNAASEPHVQDLARLLTKMGARVDGIGSNVMTVNGAESLGGAEHTICADHIEVGSFMALAAATGGELRIRDVEPADRLMVRRQFRRLGLNLESEGDDMVVARG